MAEKKKAAFGSLQPDIEDILSHGQDCQRMAFEITERVNATAAEHKDNASVILVRWNGGGK